MPAHFSKMLATESEKETANSMNGVSHKVEREADITHIHYINKPHDPQITIQSNSTKID